MGLFSQYADNNIPTLEGYQMENSHYDIFMESMEDNLVIIEAMHNFDMTNIEQEDLLQEGSISEYQYNQILTESAKDVLTKIKNGITKFFHAVMNWFKGIIDRIRALSMDGETFEKKFGDRVRKVSLKKEIKVKKYPYNTDAILNASKLEQFKGDRGSYQQIADDIVSAANGSASNMTTANSLYSDRLSNSVEKFIASDLNIKEGADALKAYFYGSNEKKEVKIKNVNEYIDNLKSTKAIVTGITKAKDITKTEFDNIIKSLNVASKNLEKTNDEGLKSDIGNRTGLINKAVSMFKNKKNAELRILNTWASALKSYINFSKAICLAAMRKG